MPKNEAVIPPQKLALYDQLIASHSQIDRKGKTMPYTSVYGHMFSFLDKDGTMSLRLPEDQREKFITDHNSELSVQHGRIMKEYVVVPSELLSRTDHLLPYLEISFLYIQSLKPKPTKKKK